MKTNYPGIDYSLGKANVDETTGIHYGVIACHSLHEWLWDDLEADYGEPHCPYCGNELESAEDETCTYCEEDLADEDLYGEEPVGYSYTSKGYSMATAFDSTELFVFLSPYFTYAHFCSPCAPGAGNLDSPCESGPKTYCLGPEWFDGEKAPYPVYDVKTGKRIN
jgi:hypothetical protein